MSRRFRRWFVPLGATALLLAGAGQALAATGPDPRVVGPGQTFVGLVNGSAVDARVKVVCDGPLNLPGTGHPVPGQTVEVVPATPLPFPVPPPGAVGFTGDAGRQIDVAFGGKEAGVPQLKLRFYRATAQIPTDVLVPCDGSGVATFAPDPTSPTARTAVVALTFVRQPPAGPGTTQ